MKTKVTLIKLIGLSAVVVTLALIYLSGERFGRFLYGLKGHTEMTAGDAGYIVGYSLGYFSIPIVGMLLLYMAYRFFWKREESQA